MFLMFGIINFLSKQSIFVIIRLIGGENDWELITQQEKNLLENRNHLLTKIIPLTVTVGCLLRMI